LASDGTLYVGRDVSGTGGVVAINGSGGIIANKALNGTAVFTSPAIGADGTIYVGDEGGKIYALEGNGSKLASSFWPKFRRNMENRGNGSVLRYSITELGTLAGEEANGMALNNLSQVVGQSLIYRTVGNGGWSFQNFGWENGQIFDNGSALTLVNYSSGFPYRINNFSTGVNGDGQVSGYVTFGSSGKRAFRQRAGVPAALFQNLGSYQLWTEPDYEILGVLNSGAPASEAHAIDAQGNVVGFSYNTALSPRATLWVAGQTTPHDLDSLTGSSASGSSYAYGISLEKFGFWRMIAGKSLNGNGVWRGFVTSPNANIDPLFDDIGAFGTLSSNTSEARDVNRLGYSVGTAQLDNGWSHAFIKQPGTGLGLGFTDLAGPSVTGDSVAVALNSYQQVVGGAGGSAFVHLAGWPQWQNLNNLIPPGTGWWQLSSANDINDRGEITGWGWHQSPQGGVVRAFLLTPIP
jgi:uncharacterized membrane protein